MHEAAPIVTLGWVGARVRGIDELTWEKIEWGILRYRTVGFPDLQGTDIPRG